MDADTIRWGIIGAGNVAEFKSGPALSQVPNSKLVAVMRRDQTKAQEFATRHGVERWYTSARELVADPQVDAVYIASPHDLHVDHVRLAAEAHKNILCEKPMGLSAAQAEECVDLCREHHVSLTVAYYRRFWPITQAIARFLRAGAIGRVVMARLLLSDNFLPDADRPWLSLRARAGGAALANAGSHRVDLIRLLLGEITHVAGVWQHDLSLDVEDGIQLELQTATGIPVSLTITTRCTIPADELDLFGTEGRLHCTSYSDGRVTLFRRGFEPELLEFPRQGVTHSYLIAELVPRLLRGEPSPVPGEEAVACWRVMETAYESCRAGSRLPVRAADHSVLDD